ncbi:hypothetical protein J437_LFUL014495 [Ladona fulva]|uniref:Mos1 transposase HTH domain-containing protein n=1 Tax=Ladona fulva TaxID=123851 RepID=A0A8K0P510_LADFU|nr:hypothetical protein J437_LFUL014495 [Ladona fulva]
MTEQRANIKFCVKLGKTDDETCQLIQRVYGTEALSKKQIKKWFNRFRDGRESIEDDSRSGPPSNNSENVRKVTEFLRTDCRVTIRLIEQFTGISKSTVNRILNNELCMKSVSNRYVSSLLSHNQKDVRVEHCKDMLRTTGKNPLFLSNIVTGGEMWCYLRGPSTNSNAADADHYLRLMEHLVEEIGRKRPEYGDQGSWSLLHDEASAHGATMVREFFAKKGIVVLNHPPQSPDLAPADFWLLPKLKLAIIDPQHSEIEEIQQVTVKFLEQRRVQEFLDCFHRLEGRLRRCIDVNGDYLNN